MTHNAFTPTAQHWRFYDSDGGEAASTALAAEDTNVTIDVSSGNVQFQFRIMVEETGGDTNGDLSGLNLSYDVNDGTPVNCTTTSGGSGLQGGTAGLSGFELDTTNRSTEGLTDGAGTFAAGLEDTSGDILGSNSLPAGDFTEYVFGLEIVAANVSDGDTIDLTFSGVTGFVDFSTPPRITVSKTDTSAEEAAATTLAIVPSFIPSGVVGY